MGQILEGGEKRKEALMVPIVISDGPEEKIKYELIRERNIKERNEALADLTGSCYVVKILSKV